MKQWLHQENRYEKIICHVINDSNSTEPVCGTPAALLLGEFSRNRLDGWKQKSFQGETRYQLQTLDGTVVLKADSHAAGSVLFKQQRVDLEQTPFLNWSWRITNRLDRLNEQTDGRFVG
jgi:hypothetical protein